MTETNTLACCKSPETSVRVTVTPLTRGSRNSKRMVSLATSRITSATRANRCAFISQSLHFHLVIDKLGHRMRSQRLHDFGEDGADRLGFVTYHRHAQDGELAVIL